MLALAAEMGYVPDDRARKLRQTEAKLIGITYELQQPFHGDVVEQIYLAAATTGYDVALSAVAPTRSEAVAVESLIRARCDAIVMLGPESSVPDMKRWAERIPVVAVARRIKAPGVAVVRGDDAAGMRAAVEYLAQLGHLRIAHIDGAEAPGSADRRASYRRTMRRLGLGELADVIEGGPEEKDGARGVQALLARPKPPTAVIAFNDRCASGVLQYANRTGVRIPGDLSVMGYDDSRLADFPHVQLTTVSQDAAEIARAAVDMALARIAGRPAQELVVRPRLVVRDTAAPPRPPLPAEMASTYDGTHAAPRS